MACCGSRRRVSAPSRVFVVTVAVRVIPCLDVHAGRVVKGVNFVALRDAGDPVELGAFYDAEGADELTFLDISASVEGRETTLDVVRRTAETVFIPLTVGGGVSSKHKKFFKFIKSRARLVPAEFLNQAGIAGAAMWAAEAKS